MLRRLLRWLYAGSGLLSCCFIVAMLGSILLQILGRFLNFTFDATEISGFFLAAATFTGLAYTFNNSAHIRMTVLIQGAGRRGRRWIELYCTGLATAGTGYLAWSMVILARDSKVYGDLSTGLLAMPLWIPQSAVAFGLVLLTIAFADEFTQVALGKVPVFKDVEEAEFEATLKEAEEADNLAARPVPPLGHGGRAVSA